MIGQSHHICQRATMSDKLASTGSCDRFAIPNGAAVAHLGTRGLGLTGLAAWPKVAA